MRNSVIGLFFWLAASAATAAVGALFRPGVWYRSLAKPSLTPPDAVFPLVWNLLFIMMAFAAWRIWRECGFRRARLSLGLYIFQLLLNAGWMWLFFGLQLPGVALAEILLLWVILLAITVCFWRCDALAGLLMLPYLLWVGFAAWLNYGLWRLNA